MYVRRFRGVGRLYGQKGLDRLRNSHVCIVGLGVSADDHKCQQIAVTHACTQPQPSQRAGAMSHFDHDVCMCARASCLQGVGSWAVEALARSGVGALTLVDLDEVSKPRTLNSKPNPALAPRLLCIRTNRSLAPPPLPSISPLLQSLPDSPVNIGQRWYTSTTCFL